MAHAEQQKLKETFEESVSLDAWEDKIERLAKYQRRIGNNTTSSVSVRKVINQST